MLIDYNNKNWPNLNLKAKIYKTAEPVCEFVMWTVSLLKYLK